MRLILCAVKGAAEAHYALDNLSNKILAAEYQTVCRMRSQSPKNWSAPDKSWGGAASPQVEANEDLVILDPLH